LLPDIIDTIKVLCSMLGTNVHEFLGEDGPRVQLSTKYKFTYNAVSHD